ncbi:MAG: hydrolase [Atopostipes suicloacalis]|nr:hydrolase [Atopostipes suicloacalis]
METLFLTMIFISVVVLLLTPFFKSAITLAVLSLAAYYYAAAIDGWAAIILLVVGLILIILEIFVPDFGLLGILGFSSMVLGLYFTTGNIGETAADLIIALSVSAILVIFLFKKDYTFTNWDRFVLNTQIKSEEKVESIKEDRQLMPGMIGKTITALRPSGKALFGDKKITFDVLSDDGHIPSQADIIIQEIIGNKIIVRKK